MNWRRPTIAAVVLAAITFVLFWPTGTFSWVNYDDNEYVIENSHVASGLRTGNILWAFTSFHMGYWIPITWISYMADVQIGGLQPRQFHVTNAVLHALNASALLLLLYCMTGTFWRSTLVAALFAWHPLNVEPVAWIAGRKDLLSTLFLFLATFAYVRYARTRSIYCYAAVVPIFLLSLCAKPMYVTWPFLLLLLDVWPLQRCNIRSFDVAQVRRLLLEKVPLLALAVTVSIVTFIAHSKQGALADLENLPFLPRVQNAVISYVEYLGKLLWPADLIVFYPFPASIPVWKVAFALAILLTVTFVALRQLKKRPYIAVGWFWFLLTLVPVIGLIKAGEQAMADRFMYLPMIGILIIVVWGFADLVASRVWLRPLVIGGAVGALLACVVVSSRQMKQWQDEMTLFTRVLQVAGPVPVARDHVGAALFREGKTAEAITHFRAALRLLPNYHPSQNNLAAALFQANEREEALAHFREALRLKPDSVRALNNYGNALLEMGEVEKAIEQYEKLLALRPNYARARNNLGVALLKQNRTAEAAEQFRKALELKPDFEQARENLEAVASRSPEP